MFGLGVNMSALIWLPFYSFSIPQSSLPSSPRAFFSSEKEKNILNVISFYGLIKPLEAEREREMER